MTEISDRYRRLTDLFADTVAGVPDDQWTSPSPCEGWTARDVVRHVVTTQNTFLGLVGRGLEEVPDVDVDPVAAWDAIRAIMQRDLEDPTAADEEFDGYFGRSTFAAAVDRFVNSDLVVHRWDLATATGQSIEIDDADAEWALAAAHEFGDAFRSPGVCGPELPAPPDADAPTRLLAYYGRAA